jgi:hypothetical protein
MKNNKIQFLFRQINLLKNVEIAAFLLLILARKRFLCGREK